MGQTAISNLYGNKVKNLKCHNSERNRHTEAKFWLFSPLVKFFQLTKNKENSRGKYTITWVIFLITKTIAPGTELQLHVTVLLSSLIMTRILIKVSNLGTWVDILEHLMLDNANQ